MKLAPVIFGAVLGLTTASTARAIPIAATGTEGLAVVAAGSGPVIATYQGTTAFYSSDLYLSMTASSPGLGGPSFNTFLFNNHTSGVGTTVDLGSFAPGTELVFRLFVTNTGDSFFTGAASRNPDGRAHARVQAGWTGGETLVSFEDLFGTPEGDRGFNDLSFSFANTTSAAAAVVPEPSSILLFAPGLAALNFVRRARRRV